ncbi:peroxisomal catalase 1-like [Maniola jurtina]|uniref:peroxisomal catalase 1-like n=1 Tax=Maniola jurtina TaxID=191418 RepID=UPI001E687302|nr:peroxisomal catalase 1-like [Maniola jurtina]
MLGFLIILAASAAAMQEQCHPAVDNALLTQIRKNSPVGLMSVSNGAPVTYCEANNSLNEPLLRNTFYMDHMTSQTRERTFRRPVHGKGAGAFGYFEVTHDISHICKASFLSEVGKRTPVAARFSSGIAEKGGSELSREVRGFSVKFYTDEGNFDIPCIATPMFVINNPSYYTKFIYGIRKHPSQYLYDPKPLWDLIIQHPESLNMFMWMFGDRGIPDGYRHMAGHNVHSLQVENEQGEQHYMRMHLMPVAGIKHLTTAEAQKISAVDPDYFTRDLFDAITKGDYPCWTVSVQIITEDDVKRCGFKLIFDVTRALDEIEFPLHQIGKMCLNRNPKNYNAEIEQLAISPANLVNGILGAPDRVYEARRFAYRDAQLRRLGPDVDSIPVNCPLHVPDDSPDSTGYVSKTGLLQIVEEKPNNFDQITKYYEGLSCDENTRLIENFIPALSVASKSVQEQVLELLKTIHGDLACRVAEGFNMTINYC